MSKLKLIERYTVKRIIDFETYPQAKKYLKKEMEEHLNYKVGEKVKELSKKGIKDLSFFYSESEKVDEYRYCCLNEVEVIKECRIYGRE